ncbi:30S ribosomal protein S6 [Ferrovibrio sp.]|uniref:30S ribosomal protein S6 n=1 Tax=Ferrovibrio sp. TaxID=1917215 RepID=UPI002623F53D|nr:30S ribosomal protein S6 [Ferrovibrio sp.]
MAFYENVFIARQDISTTQVEALVAQFSEIIKGQGGEVTKTEQWGLRNLAYRIKKNKKGHYVLMNIQASGNAVAELERNMRIHEDILRYLTIRVEKLEEGQSAMLLNKDRGERGERSERGFGDRGFGGGRGGFGGDRDRGDRGDRGGDRGDRGGERRPRFEREETAAAPESA